MAYDLIIFDWDGTLMDSQNKIVSCMREAAKRCQLTPPSEQDVKHIIGISLQPAIQQLFQLNNSQSDKQLIERIVNAYKTAFIDMDSVPSPLFEGAKIMLSDLHQRGYQLAVATGKARRGLNRAWDQTDTRHYFINSRCADEAESKPSPDMLIQLLRDHNVQPKKAIMIGDTSYDMAMAKQLNMDSIAVTYGVHDRALLLSQSPKYFAESIAELHELLIRLNKVKNR